MAPPPTAHDMARTPAVRRPQRPEQILQAACTAILARGFHDTRIADIAREARTSTGTIHYWFEGKDDVLLAALRWASEQLFARMDAVLATEAGAPEQLLALLELATPYPGPQRDTYVLWFELWAHVLRDPDLLPASEELSSRWRSFFFTVVRRGAASGAFRPVADPDEVAERLIALVDGLGFESVIGYRWTSADRVAARLRSFAAEQLGTPDLALRPAAPQEPTA